MTAPITATACKTCPKLLGRGNTSGYCNPCLNRARAKDPGFRAKQRAGIRRKLERDPAFLDALRERARASLRDPAILERRTRHWRGLAVWHLGNAAQPKGSESRMRAGRGVSEHRMAWCPRECRDEYRRLVRSKGIPAAEARAIILAQHEREMTAFRRKCGEVPAPVDPNIIPEVVVDPKAPRHERILATAAAVFAIPREAIDRPSREKVVVRARWAAMLALADEGLSLSKIAHAVGLSDHTTVSYAFSRATPLLSNDPGFAERVEMVRAA